MDASSVSLNEDQARDLIRRSERLELENADLRVRLDRDTATHKRVLAFVESDLLSTRQRRDELAEKLEEATRAQSEAEDNLKVVQTDACDALAQAQREAEERFAEELSVALAQCDSERKLKLEAQSLLQTALEQRKAEEKLRMNAERTLAASQSENDVTRASLEALERRIEDRDARIAHLESCLLAQANERSGPVASEDEAQDALVSMRSALQDKDGELVALMASYDAITLEVSQLRHGRSVDAQALRDLVQARDLKESEKADLALTISNYRRALTESSFELEDKKKELDANVQMLKVERDKVANWTVHLAARSELSSTTTHHDSLPSAATQERAGSRPPLTAGLNVHANNLTAGGTQSHTQPTPSTGAHGRVVRLDHSQPDPEARLPTTQTKQQVDGSSRKRPASDESAAVAASSQGPVEAKRQRLDGTPNRDGRTINWSKKLATLKEAVPQIAARVESCSSLPMEDSIPEENLPSLSRAYNGYISEDLLHTSYHMGPRFSSAALAMLCVESCSMKTSVFVPGAMYQLDSNSWRPDALFARLDMQPGLPIIPGQPGTLLVTHRPKQSVARIVRPLFVGLPSPDISEWLYVGDYICESEGSGPLSSDEWKKLPAQVRDGWIEALLKDPSDLSDLEGDVSSSCWRFHARMALKKRGLPSEHEKKLSRCLARYTRWSMPDLGLRKATIKTALDTGDEHIDVIRLVPKSFNKEWYLELQALSSGELERNPRCPAPPIVVHDRINTRFPNRHSFKLVYNQAVQS